MISRIYSAFGILDWSADAPLATGNSSKSPEMASTPQLPFKIPHIPTNGDHKALNGGTLRGLAVRAVPSHDPGSGGHGGSRRGAPLTSSPCEGSISVGFRIFTRHNWSSKYDWGEHSPEGVLVLSLSVSRSLSLSPSLFLSPCLSAYLPRVILLSLSLFRARLFCFVRVRLSLSLSLFLFALLATREPRRP